MHLVAQKPDSDDDLVLSTYIEQLAAKDGDSQPVVIEFAGVGVGGLAEKTDLEALPAAMMTTRYGI